MAAVLIMLSVSKFQLRYSNISSKKLKSNSIATKLLDEMDFWLNMRLNILVELNVDKQYASIKDVTT